MNDPISALEQSYIDSVDLPARWSTDEQRSEWKREAEQIGTELAQQKYDEFLQWCADQTEDYFDFLGIRGDTAI